MWGKDVSYAREGVRNYEFDGSMSREVLESYLSRSITYARLLDISALEGWCKGNFTDAKRFIENTGTKFIGRAIFRWGSESALPSLLTSAENLTLEVHNPHIILLVLQCGILRNT